MTHFLLVFDRVRGALLETRPFDDAQTALRARFDAERAHRGNASIEVVVLSAESEEALRRTHARYFETVSEMATNALRTMQNGRGVA